VDGEAEALLGEGVLKQEKDTDDANAKVRGIPIPRRGDADMRKEGMPMPRGVILNDQG
jgi:hypothetical protein